MKKIKLKTSLDFIFDKDGLDVVDDITYDIEFKEKKVQRIIEFKLPQRSSRKKVIDASTKLF